MPCWLRRSPSAEKKEKCDRRLRQEVAGKSGTLGLLLALEHRLGGKM